MVTYQRDSRQRSVLFVLVFTCLLLITLDSRGNGMVNSFRDLTQNVLAPVRTVVNDAFKPVQNLTGGLTHYGSVKDENVRLKRQLAALQGRIERERAVGSEVGELEKLLDLPTIEDATGVAARVVGGSPDNFERTVEINKGTGSGVFVGQPVVAGNGLVGKVTQASRTLATVTLIDDPSIGIGVRLEHSNVRGITEGTAGERTMHVNSLERNLSKCTKNEPPDTCLSVGELVFTGSTADAAFPPDIPVAKIVRVTQSNTDLEANISIKPLVNLDDLTYLKVLRWPEPKAG